MVKKLFKTKKLTTLLLIIVMIFVVQGMDIQTDATEYKGLQLDYKDKVVVKRGQNIELYVNATSDEVDSDDISYQWYYCYLDEEVIGFDTLDNLDSLNDLPLWDEKIQGATSSKLSISSNETIYPMYKCIVSDGYIEKIATIVMDTDFDITYEPDIAEGIGKTVTLKVTPNKQSDNIKYWWYYLDEDQYSAFSALNVKYYWDENEHKYVTVRYDETNEMDIKVDSECTEYKCVVTDGIAIRIADFRVCKEKLEPDKIISGRVDGSTTVQYKILVPDSGTYSIELMNQSSEVELGVGTTRDDGTRVERYIYDREGEWYIEGGKEYTVYVSSKNGQQATYDIALREKKWEKINLNEPKSINTTSYYKYTPDKSGLYTIITQDDFGDIAGKRGDINIYCNDVLYKLDSAAYLYLKKGQTYDIKVEYLGIIAAEQKVTLKRMTEHDYADNIVAAGKEYNGIYWELDNNGVLKVTGMGQFFEGTSLDEYSDVNVLTIDYNIKRVIISDGIDGLVRDAFTNMSEFEITIPRSVMYIGDYVYGVGYYYDNSKMNPYSMSKIKCYKDSTAYQYAVDNDIPYTLIDEDDITYSFKKTISSMNGGEKFQAEMVSNTGVNVSQSKIIWMTTDDSVATVKDGLIEAKGNGTAIIIASYDGELTSFKVDVSVPVQHVLQKVEAKEATTEEEGNIEYYVCTECDRYYKDAEGKEEITDKTSVIIPKKEIDTVVTLDKSKASSVVGGKISLKATVTGTDDTVTVKWTSSDKKIATVSSKGVITAKKAGTVVITVTTSNGKSATCKLTVKLAPKKISFAKTKITLKKGKTTKLKYTITKKTYTTVTFSSSNKKVVSVDKNGKIKALKKGTATITVKTANGKKATCKVTVK